MIEFSSCRDGIGEVTASRIAEILTATRSAREPRVEMLSNLRTKFPRISRGQAQDLRPKPEGM